jgi:transcriptional regulator with XRE-family HTH domain
MPRDQLCKNKIWQKCMAVENARQTTNMNQQKLAMLVGATQSEIARFENGNHGWMPNLPLLSRYATA